MINTHDLNCFLTTAKILHLTKASKELGLSQPALSHSIKRLEESLGESLFLRRKDGLILTSAGELLKNKGQKILEDLNSVEGMIRHGHADRKTTLSLGVHTSVAAYTFPRIMSSLREIEIQFKFGLSREVTEWVHEGKVDCGIIINPYPHSDMIIQKLDTDEVNLWCHKKKYDQEKLFYDPQLHQSHALLRQLQKKGISFKTYYPIPNLELIAQFVYEGSGVGILPARVIKNNHPEITRPFKKEIKAFHDEICFAYSVENKSKESLSIFKNELKKVFH